MANRKPRGAKTELHQVEKAANALIERINKARNGEGVDHPLNCSYEELKKLDMDDDVYQLMFLEKEYRRLYRKAWRYGIPTDEVWPDITDEENDEN